MSRIPLGDISQLHDGTKLTGFNDLTTPLYDL